MGEIKLQSKVLQEGIVFHHIESDTYKTDYLNLYFSLPLTTENASYSALLSRMLVRGSASYTSMRLLNRALDSCYSANLDSEVFKSGESQVLSLSASVLADRFALKGESIMEELLGIVTDVVFSPCLREGSFDAAALEGEKQNAADAIRAQINNKMSYARKQMYHFMCADEAYCVDPLGEENTIRAIDGASLADFHRRLLESARVEIFHVGKSNPGLIAHRLAECFARIARAPLPPVEIQVKRSHEGEVRFVREKADVTQANLVLGLRTGTVLSDSDYSAFTLFNAILGGSLTSKLFVNVREKLSLCYTVGSRPDTAKGVMAIYCGIDPDKYNAAYQEILRQLELTQKGEITHREMEQSANAIINSLTGLEDTPSAISDWFYSRILAGDSREPGELIAALKTVTAEQVAQVAQKVSLDTVFFLEGERKEADNG